MNKIIQFLVLLECTLVVRPVLNSCQVCCVSETISACRFVRECPKGIEPEQEPTETKEETKEEA